MVLIFSAVVYLLVSIAATAGAARMLRRSGDRILSDAFYGNADLALAINQLLVAGFFLINIGYIAVVLRALSGAHSIREAIPLVIDKVGFAFLFLGGMLFFLLYVLNRLRNRGRLMPPPLPSEGRS